ncbi:hypothetical protein MANES_09G048028v8 [Manihot esculenta]|uniref:Uncharacterized protein n=1 Tax=Manihot esculenta TaxID=3983 RepID=A0ACB7H564_MANES|nr:hypothetical protein MANES_09G048028v8 [Manihot esculenta]
MKKRLEGWRAKTLSMAGRTTLVKSVLSSLPIYPMQCNLLSVSLCKEMEQVCRDFIWQGSNQSLKVHLVAWDILKRPRDHGGLGIRDFSTMNKALLGKLAWRAMENDDCLWTKCFIKKYLQGRSKWTPNAAASSSHIWKAFCKGYGSIKDGLMVDVRNGSSTNFWFDSWLSIGPLAQFALIPIDDSMATVSVRHFWSPLTGWNWDVLKDLLPDNILQFIQPICLSNVAANTDSLSWKWSSKVILPFAQLIILSMESIVVMEILYGR